MHHPRARRRREPRRPALVLNPHLVHRRLLPSSDPLRESVRRGVTTPPLALGRKRRHHLSR